MPLEVHFCIEGTPSIQTLKAKRDPSHFWIAWNWVQLDQLVAAGVPCAPISDYLKQTDWQELHEKVYSLLGTWETLNRWSGFLVSELQFELREKWAVSAALESLRPRLSRVYFSQDETRSALTSGDWIDYFQSLNIPFVPVFS